MKSVAVLSFAMLADAASLAQLFAYQIPFFDLNGSKSVPVAPVNIKKLPATLEKDSVREKLIWGPFKVKAANDSHAMQGIQFKLDSNSDLIKAPLGGLCKDCIVLFTQADVSDKDGNKLDLANSGIYSHHILGTDYGRKMVPPPIVSRCADGSMGGFRFEMPGMGGNKGGMGGGMSHSGGSAHARKRQLDLGKMASQFLGSGGPKLSPEAMAGLAKLMPAISVFVAQGDEGSATAYHGMNKIKSGFALGTDDKITMMAEVINYDKVAKEVYLSLDYEYVKKPVDRKEYYDVGQGAINVSPCSTSSLHPPKDKAERYVSPAWQVMADGYLLDVKPHLHDGGINATFYVNGNAACTSKAVYGGDGGIQIGGQKWETITAYTPCPEPVKITKGDNLTMEAFYDLTQHRLRPQADNHDEGAEGMALALFQYARPPPKQ